MGGKCIPLSVFFLPKRWKPLSGWPVLFFSLPTSLPPQTMALHLALVMHQCFLRITAPLWKVSPGGTMYFSPQATLKLKPCGAKRGIRVAQPQGTLWFFFQKEDPFCTLYLILMLQKILLPTPSILQVCSYRLLLPHVSKITWLFLWLFH